MLEVEDLNQSYGMSRTLWNVAFTIPDGACLCVMGRNGVGKTTLLKCLMGLLPGRHRLDPLCRRGSACDAGGTPCPTGDGLRAPGTDDLSVANRGREPGRGVGRIAARRSAQIPREVYELFPVLDDMRTRRGGDLSGGQQQQLAIGRALVLRPKFLILDEPTEGIQPNVVQQIGDVVVRLNRELGMTVLLVEQKLPFVRRVADRFAIMTKGSIVADGPLAALTDALIEEHLTV